MELPKEVAEALSHIRKGSARSVTLKRIRGGYYAYEYEDGVDKETGARKRSYLYLGRIGLDGGFSAASRRLGRGSGAGGRVTGTEADAYVGKEDRAILEEMSANSRESLAEMEKRTKISKGAIAYRMRRLKERYKIRTTIEIKSSAFGFERYIATVRFKRGRPDNARLREVLSKEPMIQAAFACRGHYDLVLYIISEGVEKLEDMIYDMRSRRHLSEYPAIWDIGYCHELSPGYLPLTDDFFSLIEGTVWKKTRESTRKGPGQLLMSEYAVMKELNRDADTSFAEIDRKYGFKEGIAHYAYHRLMEKQIIERATITMVRPPAKYCVFFYIVQVDMGRFNIGNLAFRASRSAYTMTALNKYLFVGEVSAPYGMVVIAPIYKDGGVEELEAEIGRLAMGCVIRSTIISDVLVGQIGYRRSPMEKEWESDAARDAAQSGMKNSNEK